MPERGVGFQPDCIAHVVESSLLIIARDRTSDESENLACRFHLSQSLLKIGHLVHASHFNNFVKQSHRLGLTTRPLYIWVVKHEGVFCSGLHCDEANIPTLMHRDPCRVGAVFSPAEGDGDPKRHFDSSRLKWALISNCLSYNCCSRCNVSASSGPLSSRNRAIR